MKNVNKILMLTTATLVLAFSVNAHDPSLHAKKAPAKADCSAYNKMLESGAKMDMSDPVMVAMMKKCKDQKAKSEHDNADGHHDLDENEKSSGHKDKGEMKYGGDMKNATKKVEKKVEEDGKHNH